MMKTKNLGILTAKCILLAILVYPIAPAIVPKLFSLEIPGFNEVHGVAYIPGSKNKYMVGFYATYENLILTYSPLPGAPSPSATIIKTDRATEIFFGSPYFGVQGRINQFTIFKLKEDQESIERVDGISFTAAGLGGKLPLPGTVYCYISYSGNPGADNVPKLYRYNLDTLAVQMIAVYEPSHELAFVLPFYSLIVSTSAGSYYVADVSKTLQGPLTNLSPLNADIDGANHVALPQEDNHIFTGNFPTDEVIMMNYLDGTQNFRLLLSNTSFIRNISLIPKTKFVLVNV